MSTNAETDDLAALIELHQGLPRQGPGDADFTRALLCTLPALPPCPRIADLGCGSGAGALLLAEHFGCPVTAVDQVAVLLDELVVQAQAAGLGHLVRPVQADMGALDWPAGALDLLWSEGAAYTLGFETALRRWRPLLAPGGVAVVSELSWFGATRPDAAAAYWQAAYPGMGSESENRARAQRAGFRVLATPRLPTAAWWTNYYEPLRARLRHWPRTGVRQAVALETETEMALFAAHGEHYGYTFYVLQTDGGT